jgi:hypothetical protein
MYDMYMHCIHIFWFYDDYFITIHACEKKIQQLLKG